MAAFGAHGGGRRLIFRRGAQGLAEDLTLTEIDARAVATANVLSVRLGETGLEIDLPEGRPPTVSGQSFDATSLFSDDVRIYAPILPTIERPDDPLPQTLAAFADKLLEDPPAPVLAKTPAAYTYLGQFIAHDISLTRRTVGGNTLALLPGALRFDSLLGRETPTPPRRAGDLGVVGALEAGAIGLTAASPGFAAVAGDLPREADGWPRVPDPRNDSNLNLAQLHVLFIRFVRAARQALASLEPEAQLRVMRRHLQAVVWHDYVRRLVPTPVLDDLRGHGRRLVATPFNGGVAAFHVPPEFAWGAFQVPHAMIRERYQPWGFGAGQVADPPGNATLATLLGQTYAGLGLVGGRLADDWRMNWDSFLGPPEGPAPTPAVRAGTRLRSDVFRLPGRFFTVVEGDVSDRPRNLALRTMEIAYAMGVPTGQDLAAFAANAGADVKALTPEELAAGLSLGAQRVFRQRRSRRRSLAERTPLWFYCLRECEMQGGECFGPLGGRIVAETLHAAIEASGTGFFDPATGWDAGAGPRLPSRRAGTFDLYDLRALAETP